MQKDRQKWLGTMNNSNYQTLTIVQIPWSPSNLLITILLPMQISLMRKIYDDHADSNSPVYVIIIIFFVNQ